jgi:hypothetical protein
MLLELPYKNGDTITFKTVAGEEVIARLEEETATKLKVSKPMALTATQQGLGMVPFTFTVNPATSIQVMLSSIVFIAKTDDEMAKQYLTSTTGIAI